MYDSNNMCYRAGYVLTTAVAAPILLCTTTLIIMPAMLITCSLVGPVEYIIAGEMPISQHVFDTCFITSRKLLYFI